MIKQTNEVRDPIHTFIRLNSTELKILNSRSFQRLRHIHQLALTYLVYPGATHRRFEHSLGVMELAGRVYDVITDPNNLHDALRDIVPKDRFEYSYWRLVLRMAALCHDLGHLPFSHAAEKELLPKGWDHERFTVEIIRSEELQSIWDEMKIKAEDVAKLAVGPKKYKESLFSNWEAILSEIIVGDAFGVDRIDYLLRDSHHAGVAYGKFDHYRLIDCLKILPKAEGDSCEPVLGIDEGGIHAAEALILARYFMYTQVYFHKARRIYDIHLKDFLKSWLPDKMFPTDIIKHLEMTDNEVTAAIWKASKDPKHPGHDPAKRIVNREHYRKVYERNPNDVLVNPEAGKAIFKAACERYGNEKVRHDYYSPKGSGISFPVLADDGRIISSLSLSETLRNVPSVAIDYVFVSPEIRKEAEEWINDNLNRLIQPTKED
ncbi:MAG: HD domain-containing protein [Bacteroidota bacterium]